MNIKNFTINNFSMFHLQLYNSQSNINFIYYLILYIFSINIMFNLNLLSIPSIIETLVT